MRLPAIAVSTLALVAAPTAMSGLSWAQGAGPGATRPGSMREVALSGLDAHGAREPGAVSRAAVVAPGARSLAADGTPATTAVTPALDLPGEVAVVGASWPASGRLGRGGEVQVRTRSHGQWGAWQALDTDDAHGPDTTGPGAAEGRAARSGTAPLVVTGAEAVQVRVEGSAPAPSTRVELVDPGEKAADPTAGATRPDAAAAAASRPTIYSRKAWGADESLRKGGVAYGSVQAAFVHHTVSTNSYTAAEVPAIIRGIYRFHVQGRGWNDIGYNFLVDRFGRIWEGRYGGVALPVIGAHTQGYNAEAFAMSAIGNFDVAKPPAAMVSAYSRLFAWKLGLHGVPATGAVTLNGTRLQRINGHRDAGQTACPGRYLYARLATIRSATAAAMGPLRRDGVARSVDGGGTPDVLASAGTGSAAGLVLRESTAAVAGARVVGASGWQRLGLLTLSPDLTGDGRPDLLGRDSSGRVRVYPGTGTGRPGTPAVYGRGWGAIQRLIAPGDLDRDGRNDLLAVDARGGLRFYPGTGRGWVRAPRLVGTNWLSLSLVVAARDLTGDGVPDLLAVRKRDGALVRYAGDGHGDVRPAATIGRGWSSFDAGIGGDFDGDQHPDLVVRERRGTMRTYYGTSYGTVRWRVTWGRDWQTLSSLTGGLDVDGDGAPDVLAVTSAGSLRLLPGVATREYRSGSTSAVDLSRADRAFVAGDLDGDGRAEVVTRDAATGDVTAWDGARSVGASSPAGTRLASGWAGADLLAPAGDISRDGRPDLLVEDDADQVLYLYPTTSSGALGQRYVIATGWPRGAQAVGVGSWDADAAADVIALLPSGELRLYPGNGPGRLLAPRRLAASSPLTRLLGAGDVDGDGASELLGSDASGRLLAVHVGTGGSLGTVRVMVLDARAGGRLVG
ncbi:hypothetical protein ASD06_02655 [Angustibacter sp. Root456]|nr:hypothetical protein ASD06_02655 [Angustibacter sp. Root456]